MSTNIDERKSIAPYFLQRVYVIKNVMYVPDNRTRGLYREPGSHQTYDAAFLKSKGAHASLENLWKREWQDEHYQAPVG